MKISTSAAEDNHPRRREDAATLSSPGFLYSATRIRTSLSLSCHSPGSATARPLQETDAISATRGRQRLTNRMR